MIDEKKLIEVIKKDIVAFKSEIYPDDAIREYFAGLVDSQPKLATFGEWIPTLERLPKRDKNRRYLVRGKNGDIYIANFFCRTVPSGLPIGPWWYANGRYCHEPIAWMPLPEAYKGE